MKNQKNQKLVTIGLISLFLMALFPLGLVNATSYTVTLSNGTHGSLYWYDNSLGAWTAKRYAGTFSLSEGTPITVSPKADTGYVFSYWQFSGYISGTTAQTDIQTTVYSSFTLTPVFIPVTTYLDINLQVEPQGTGTISVPPYVGDYQITEGMHRIMKDRTITVTALPAYGYRFDGFVKTVSGENTTYTSNPSNL
jgi:hypothetical protein